MLHPAVQLGVGSLELLERQRWGSCVCLQTHSAPLQALQLPVLVLSRSFRTAVDLLWRCAENVSVQVFRYGGCLQLPDSGQTLGHL